MVFSWSLCPLIGSSLFDSDIQHASLEVRPRIHRRPLRLALRLCLSHAIHLLSTGTLEFLCKQFLPAAQLYGHKHRCRFTWCFTSDTWFCGKMGWTENRPFHCFDVVIKFLCPLFLATFENGNYEGHCQVRPAGRKGSWTPSNTPRKTWLYANKKTQKNP